MKYKFRGFDKKEKKMYYFDLKEYMSYNENGQERLCSYEAKNELMQYTELNDRVNNKEIYDKDIVKALNRRYDNKDDREDYFETFEVTYLNGCWMFGNYNAHEFFNKFIYIEIIGNKLEGVKEKIKYEN